MNREIKVLKLHIKINFFHNIKLGASQTVLSAETFWPQNMLTELHIKNKTQWYY
jgi:hypothetical protein